VKSEVVVGSASTEKEAPLVVERDKVCPFLLRMFVKHGNHHRPDEFSLDKQPYNEELQIYTWRDASLKELAGLIKEVYPETKAKDYRMSFRMIYFDLSGRPKTRELGEVNNASKGDSDLKTLNEIRFVIGDFIDVAVLRGGVTRLDRPDRTDRGERTERDRDRDRDRDNRGGERREDRGGDRSERREDKDRSRGDDRRDDKGNGSSSKPKDRSRERESKDSDRWEKDKRFDDRRDRDRDRRDRGRR